MVLFSGGQHSINKKYERFSDVHRMYTKYRRRTRSYRPNGPDADSASGDFILPARRARYSKKRVSVTTRLWSVFPFKHAVSAGAKLRARLCRIRESRAAALLGYIPTKLFIGLCVITLGLYPYTWLWNNVYAFNKVGGQRIDDNSIKRLAVVGFIVQMSILATAASYIAWRVTGMDIIYKPVIIAASSCAVLYSALVFPMKCFNYFAIRWAIRSAVIEWDREGVMIGRTMTSWLKLFLFGSAYIQCHINRLMGLGMAGFADVSEIELDASIGELIDDYVTVGKTDRASASWTKDDWKSEYGEEEEYEEDYGEL
ncbi:MAG: hypothetical protein LBK91_07275 [Synergistaceae bacterium]|jgi:hypothetical protein|nr:hypothetical protein [Synergistaceae bacterium]